MDGVKGPTWKQDTRYVEGPGAKEGVARTGSGTAAVAQVREEELRIDRTFSSP